MEQRPHICGAFSGSNDIPLGFFLFKFFTMPHLPHCQHLATLPQSFPRTDRAKILQSHAFRNRTPEAYNAGIACSSVHLRDSSHGLSGTIIYLLSATQIKWFIRTCGCKVFHPTRDQGNRRRPSPLSSSGGCKGPVKTLVVSYLTPSSRGIFPVVLSSFLATIAIVPPFLGGQQVSWESRRRGKWQVVVAQAGVVGGSR
jgi:hypothetical protein